jgi:putative ATPase
MLVIIVRMEFFDQSPEEPPQPAKFAPRTASGGNAPLAERMRPRTFDEWVGQQRVAGPGSALRQMLAAGRLPSLVFWGPPGCGKTTLARLLANASDMIFEPLSAVTSGIKDVKEVIARAGMRQDRGRKTLLFIDEIHRFNKAQQDAFLPHVESGLVTLIGATTENPSFSVIAPLLSRCRVLTLERLGESELITLLQRALADPQRGLGAEPWVIDDEVLNQIAGLAEGDARRALGLLEQATTLARAAQPVAPPPAATPPDANADANAAVNPSPAPLLITTAMIKQVLDRDRLVYDRGGEEHFNLISAFHKSMRASDPDGTVYWLFRMLEAGEDPLWVARRIVACASEDVGMADPQALQVAVAAMQAFQSLGLPEGELPLAHAAIYVASAPKSNSVNVAREAAKAIVRQTGALPVPLHLRNAPTGLMKSLGYGREYVYDHDAPDHFSGQPTLPDKLAGTTFYVPGTFGFEREIQKRIDWWNARRHERRSPPDGDANVESDD